MSGRRRKSKAKGKEEWQRSHWAASGGTSRSWVLMGMSESIWMLGAKGMQTYWMMESSMMLGGPSRIENRDANGCSLQ